MAKAFPSQRRPPSSADSPHHSLALTISSSGSTSDSRSGRSNSRFVRRMSSMGLCDDVRRHCATVAAGALWVTIDLEALGRIEPGPPPVLDPERHYLEGPREDGAAYLLTLDAINFGSGWFPTLRKRPGSSGYYTVAWALADRFREHGPWTNEELRALGAAEVARVLEQDAEHALMELYARALRELGQFLGDRGAIEVVAEAGGSAERRPAAPPRGAPIFDKSGR